MNAFLVSLQRLLLIAIFGFASAGRAQTTPPQINVTGSAEIKVVPDQIDIRLGVESRHATLVEAKRMNDADVSRVLQFLKKQGIKEKDLQTDFISIDPQYAVDSSVSTPRFYMVRRNIGVRLNEAKDFEKVLSGALESGATTVHGIEFRTTELRKHRDAARARAVQAAREKADALAGELGVKRGKPYSINANEGGGWWSWSGGYGARGGAMFQNISQNAAGGPAESEGTLALGQISVSASVNVSFLIE